MADFGKAGRYGAYVYATSYAGFADSSIHRRPPDSGFRIRIRGAGVAVADTEPLMVVDGRPFVAGDSIVRSISPDEIEAIDVVHCMKAVVRFGRRASRGAVLITMKARAPRPPKSR